MDLALWASRCADARFWLLICLFARYNGPQYMDERRAGRVAMRL